MRATDGTTVTLIYADIGPNAVSRVQRVMAPDDSNYKVQYASINYNTKAPQNLCVPITSMTKVVDNELKSGIRYITICMALRNNQDLVHA